MRHHKATKFFGRKVRILDRLRKIRALELEVQAMRVAQKKLLKDHPDLIEDIDFEDFV